MNPIFRFGLSPGSALLLVGLLELINPLMTIWIDFGGIFALHSMGLQGIGFWECFYLVIVLGEMGLVCGLLIYGVLLQGSKLALMWWMGCTTAYFIFFILLDLIFMDWAGQDAGAVLNSMYLMIMWAVIFAYEMNLAYLCLPSFDAIGDLEPIGKGWRFFKDFFRSHAREGAALVLMFEIIFNTEIFLDRQVSRFVFGHEFLGHEGGWNVGILMEETVLRYIRIGLAVAGFYLTYKEKQYWMSRWCVAYLVTIAISLGDFVYLLISWRAEHAILTFIYLFMFILNIFYRVFALFLCVRYTDVFERMGIPM